MDKLTTKLLPTVWIMKTKDGFYLIQPTEKCRPEDYGAINNHVMSIEYIDGNVVWERVSKLPTPGETP